MTQLSHFQVPEPQTYLIITVVLNFLLIKYIGLVIHYILLWLKNVISIFFLILFVLVLFFFPLIIIGRSLPVSFFKKQFCCLTASGFSIVIFCCSISFFYFKFYMQFFTFLIYIFNLLLILLIHLTNVFKAINLHWSNKLTGPLGFHTYSILHRCLNII